MSSSNKYFEVPKSVRLRPSSSAGPRRGEDSVLNNASSNYFLSSHDDQEDEPRNYKVLQIRVKLRRAFFILKKRAQGMGVIYAALRKRLVYLVYLRRLARYSQTGKFVRIRSYFLKQYMFKKWRAFADKGESVFDPEQNADALGHLNLTGSQIYAIMRWIYTSFSRSSPAYATSSIFSNNIFSIIPLHRIRLNMLGYLNLPSSNFPLLAQAIGTLDAFQLKNISPSSGPRL